ncbi:beta-lactamase class A [Propionicimonas paludicola]|uniref:Beta-lactamase class A n=1 Tax=Propionicimonas paludicola TaxID=185243 RepID=A0A2A9CQH5_9ACTN|nr:serine hydrolase [Propionicimonas paludicola]PFG15910.1 beta-lactamase class A [Propionicimonas paludicola]
MTRPTGRRMILLGLITALATTLGACTAPVRIPEPSPSPTGTIPAQLDQALKTISGGSDKFGVYLEDLKSHTTYSYRGDYSSQSASMAKPMIVAMALRKAGGVAQLSPENQENARKAITHSDNDAAQALWDYAGGGPAYTALAADLGMTNTHLDQAKPTQWSWTWTTPADQMKLLDVLAGGTSSALTAEEAKFIYDLMGQVEDDQTWGVGQPKSGTVSVHLKNGWVQFKSSDGLWAVNSIGTVSGDGRDYRLAVMTRDTDFDTGRELTSMVGKWVFAIEGSATK